MLWPGWSEMGEREIGEIIMVLMFWGQCLFQPEIQTLFASFSRFTQSYTVFMPKVSYDPIKQTK